MNLFDQRPILVALAGPNGAGKSTFYQAHLAQAGLRFVNADVLGGELGLEPYAAAKAADLVRRELVRQRESFVFETVFSDPAGDKLAFLQEAAEAGYTVVLCYIGISGAKTSDQRVAMRVSQGGHDVPRDKLVTRFPRTLANLNTAMSVVPHVIVYDNEDLNRPYRRIAVFENETLVFRLARLPRWLSALL